MLKEARYVAILRHINKHNEDNVWPKALLDA